jgi:hypothetical protein
VLRSYIFVDKSYNVLSSQNTTVFRKWYMEYLYYQLYVSASTLAIIRLALNLSRYYTICMVCSGGDLDKFIANLMMANVEAETCS